MTVRTPEHLMSHQGTLIQRRPSGTDEYGNPTLSEMPLPVKLHMYQTSASDSTEASPDGGGYTATAGWRALVPASTDVQAADGIEVGGTLFEVIGPPWPVRNALAGVTTHIELRLREAE